MRAVLDTSVLLGALIAPQGLPTDAIYRAWRAERFDLVTSTAQLYKLRQIGRYPRLKAAILPAHRIETIVNNMQRAIILDALPPASAVADSAANKDKDALLLLSMAQAGEADYWVTDNLHCAQLSQRGGTGRTRVVTPEAFRDLLAR
ncbi:MAG: PIN domain-containing protein [Burkholderiaceae bacterium]|jgi:predicted nucleic acid-binding protein|nr:PIN domain-containing protein [Burkholderiaceae bacterium]